MAESLNSASFVSPIINEETYDGTWYNSGSTSTIGEDGSGVVTLQLSIQYRDIPFQVSAISSDASVETRQQLGLTTETPEPVVAVDGQIKSQQVEILEDSSKNVRTSRDSGVVQTNITTTKSPDATIVSTEKTVQTTALTDSTPADGTIRRIINAVSKYYNRYTTTETIETGVAQELINTIRAPSATVMVTQKTVQTDQVTVPVLEAGVLKRIKNVWSKYFNRWDTVEEVETGIAQTTTTTSVSASETVVVSEKTVQTAEVATPTATAGKIKRVVNKPSKYPERYDTIEDTNTGTAQTTTTKIISPSGTTDITIKTVQPSSISAPSSEKGHIKQVVNKASNYPDRFDTTESDSVPTDQTETSNSQTAFESSSIVMHTENSSSLSAPTPEVGKIKSNRNSPTESGNTRTEASERTSIAKTVSYTASISDDGTSVVEKGRNAATIPTITAVDGADVRVEGDINEFQKYDYVKRTDTSNIPLSCPGVVSWKVEGDDYIIYSGKTYDKDEGKYYATGESKYRITYWHGIAFYKTAALAAAALPSIAAAIGGLRVESGSGVSKAGGNLWLATVRSRNDVYISFTNYGGPIWI